jgi:hypothetical protein
MKPLSRLFFLLFCGAGSAFASYIVLGNSGVVVGTPGQTVGWDFTIYNTEPNDWMFINAVFPIGETSPLYPIGETFTDYAGYNNGPLPYYAIAPLGQWSDTFSLGNPFGTGLGAYPIDLGVLAGTQDTGYFEVLYTLYQDSGGAPGDQDGPGNIPLYTTSSGTAFASFQVDVQGAPEPGTAFLIGAGLILAAAGLRRKRSLMASKRPGA